ncbi:Sel1 repeat [Aspergillus parasiticus SU-1]|uniref:Sel1 repeat n=1 Tax=Aspergillus parasiticus (strain ATCC 56775 / NRRL 5862 / SRRC 143 / SU-1) TaxID=1403190 RepID=A0A0F0I2M0_ASPPU|nr:Sel1 repeat [Aspergillus parasiticus SU-1]
MPLREILHKKDRINDTSGQYAAGVPSAFLSPVPQIIRSDTTSHEVVTPPIYDGDDVYHHQNTHLEVSPPSSSSRRRSLNPFSRSRAPSESLGSPPSQPRERRLSQLLHRDRRHSTATSTNIPSNLPQINNEKGDEQEREAQWEKRATVLVQRNPNLGSPLSPTSPGFGRNSIESRSRSSSRSGLSDPQGDVNIQEAIRLHEAGGRGKTIIEILGDMYILTQVTLAELEKSTEMFRRLADPNGANNALSQVLYGLALRHGWGCPKSEEQAVTYLSAAASNSASIESQALQAGMKKGGAAKGELVLAIFELGNCFRNGWGVKKDPAAARQYFETAANLGDTDAMNEVAWCYLEGFGGKKDKFAAAKYYRLAEQKGSKLVGNSWYVRPTLG